MSDKKVGIACESVQNGWMTKQARLTRNTRNALYGGIALGVLYGVVLRVSVGTDWGTRHHFSGVMTLSFVVLGPLMLGMLSVYPEERVASRKFWEWILSPWPAFLTMCLVTALFKIEGIICIAMACPIGLVLSSLGGVVGGLTAQYLRLRGRTVACLAFLPFLLAPAETHLTAPTTMRTVRSEILIHASSATVWRNIERVPAIAPAELKPTWTHILGFPRPVEATLSYEGVGGVRHATFERGLMFIETVTRWEPEHVLAFGIKADSAKIPATALDEHVTIGGPYFDVLDGEYRLETLGDGSVLLHLTSHQRLSTDFNGYAGLWTDAAMQSLQTSILEVISARCERE